MVLNNTTQTEAEIKVSLADVSSFLFSLKFLLACVLIGLVVTVVCLVRFLRNRRVYTFLPYVTCILVTNAGFLTISLLMTLQRMTLVLPMHDFACKLLLYVQAVLNNSQMPCIAAIALQLYVTVFSKLGHRLPCTCRKTRSSSGQRFALASFVFLAAVVNAKLMSIAESDDGVCILGAIDEHWLKWISWANAVLFCFVPFLITLFANVTMLVKLVCVEQRLRAESVRVSRTPQASEATTTFNSECETVVDLVSSALLPISILVNRDPTIVDRVRTSKRNAHSKRRVQFAVDRLRRRVRRQRKLTTAGVLTLLFVIIFLKLPNHIFNLYLVIHGGDIHEYIDESILEIMNMVCFISFHLQFIVAPLYIFTNALLRQQPSEYV